MKRRPNRTGNNHSVIQVNVDVFICGKKYVFKWIYELLRKFRK